MALIGKTRRRGGSCCGIAGGKRRRGRRASTHKARRVQRKRTTQKHHRRAHRKRTMRKGCKQRGGFLSSMIGAHLRPAKWELELRSAFMHGVATVTSLDKAITQVINSKIYVKTAASESYRMAIDGMAIDVSAVMQLLEEADTEISSTRTDVAEVIRRMVAELRKQYPDDAAAAEYQQTVDKKLMRPSRVDTTTPKGSWVKELKAAYDSVIAAASLLKNRSIPMLEQAKKDGRLALEETARMQNIKIEEVATRGLRDLKDAHGRLSDVAKKIADELSKHNIKNFARTHDYNLRHYLSEIFLSLG